MSRRLTDKQQTEIRRTPTERILEVVPWTHVDIAQPLTHTMVVPAGYAAMQILANCVAIGFPVNFTVDVYQWPDLPPAPGFESPMSTTTITVPGRGAGDFHRQELIDVKLACRQLMVKVTSDSPVPDQDVTLNLLLIRER